MTPNKQHRQSYGMTAASTDLLIIAILSVLLFAVAASFDVFNAIIGWIYAHDTRQLDELFTVMMFWTLAFLVYTWRRKRELMSEIRRRETAELGRTQAQDEVKVLTRLLPVCAWCKKIRDDQGYWNQLEEYVGKQTGTKISHGICPECAEKMMADVEASAPAAPADHA